MTNIIPFPLAKRKPKYFGNLEDTILEVINFKYDTINAIENAEWQREKALEELRDPNANVPFLSRILNECHKVIIGGRETLHSHDLKLIELEKMRGQK